MRERVSRRDFLKIATMSSLSLFLPHELQKNPSTESKMVREIFDLATPLSFDSSGNLVIGHKHLEGGSPTPVNLIPTRYSKDTSVEDNKVEAVKLLVVHFDGADKHYLGRPRTARSTVYGLDGKYASAHWCVDEYPVNPQGDEKTGFGILQTQLSSDPEKPYQGAHILIGINLKTGAPDRERIKTLQIFEKLGIKSNLKELVERGDNDYDKFTVGFEQVGVRYSVRFPNYFPNERQIANVLSLTMAAMKQWGLSAWDVVGHKEIQDKDDPGAEFMATLRFLLGVAALKNYISPRLVLGEDEPIIYFGKVRNYLQILRGPEAYRKWQGYLGFEAFVNGLESRIPR